MRNALRAALLVPLFLSPFLHTPLPPSRQQDPGETTQRNVTNISALRVLAYEGDPTALQRLTTLAQEGSRDAALALYTLALWSDVRVPDSMLAVDLQPFVQQARQGHSQGVLALHSFALWGNERAGTFLTAIDPAPFIAQSSGSTDAVLALLSLADWGEAPIQRFLSTFDARRLMRQAAQGSGEAVMALYSLADWSQPSIQPSLRTLDPRPFVDQVSARGCTVIPALSSLASSANRAALEVLLRLLSQGNREADDAIRYISHKRIITLRKAHLDEKISDRELDRRLTSTTFGDDPFILYAGYTSGSNFGVLSRMIFRRLMRYADRSGKDLHAFLTELDPRKVFYKDFILQSANFSQLQQAISSARSLHEVLDDLFKDSSESTIATYGARLAFFVDKVTVDKSFPFQKEFQEYLTGLYGRTDGLNQYFIGAVLSIYRHQLPFVSQANIDDINRMHGIRDDDTRIDYGRLLRDSKLVVHMVFADKDAVQGHYAIAVKSFLRADVPDRGGYRTIASTRQEDILEKGNVRIVFVNTLHGGYDIARRLGEASLIVSRGHDGSVSSVFKRQPEPIGADGRIFFLSACRTLTTTGRLSSYYPGASFIGVDGTSYGEKTNYVVYYLLEALEREIPTFKEIEAFVGSRVGKDAMKDYVFPDNNALKVQRNVNDFLAGRRK